MLRAQESCEIGRRIVGSCLLTVRLQLWWDKMKRNATVLKSPRLCQCAMI